MRLALLASTRCPGTVIVNGLDVVHGLAATSIVVVSGFQSPVEKEALKFLLRGTPSLIVCPARSAVGMRTPSVWKKPISEGRLTIRSFIDEAAAAKDGAAAKPRKGPRRPTIDVAELRNRFVASICDAVLILHASPGGKLDRLADELLAAGKPVWTLDDPANHRLREMGARALRPEGVTRLWKESASPAHA